MIAIVLNFSASKSCSKSNMIKGSLKVEFSASFGRRIKEDMRATYLIPCAVGKVK